MADPDVISPMDTLDYISVIFYRSGFALAVPALILLPWDARFPGTEILFIAAVLCASSLHVYSKSIRWVLQAATWGGLLLTVLGAPLVGLGGAMVTLGGLAYKEYFCFKVPGLNYQPLILAGLWCSQAFSLAMATHVLSLISAFSFLLLAIAKWRMPLHFDIGDKSKYQI